MNTQKYITELHTQNTEWQKSLSFAKDELTTFKNRLAEITQQNTKEEVLAPLEHFQNQFVRHFEVIDELVHDIHGFEKEIAANVQENEIASDHRKTDENSDLVSRMESFEKIFNELKVEFTEYLKKVL